MKTIKIVLLLIAVSQLALAQVPSLSVYNKKESLAISELNIDIEVLGNTATTTFDIVFYNPHDRVLEGDLSMSLKNGQEICRYALDVNGKLREGVIVEKIKARKTFEAVVRQKIDPGIINKTKGNSFNTKIYPIPAKGNKRVVLALVETLVGDSENLYYSLPLESMPEAKHFSLNVEVIKSNIKDEKINSSFQNIEFDNQNDACVFHMNRNNFKTTEPLNFTIPQVSKDNSQLFTYDFEGQTYFYLSMQPDKLNSNKKKSPKNISIFWDNSFSASKRKIAEELNLLQSYLDNLSEVNILVTVFNQTVSEQKNFTSADEVINYIKGFGNDGATLFESIKLPSNVDEILIFSDGVNTIGKDEIELVNVPIYAISSSSGSNYSFLKRICTKTNGEFIDLGRMSNDRALELLTYDEERFLSCDYNSKYIKDIYPNLPTRVDNYFEISGTFIGKEIELKLNFGGKSGITQTKTYTIDKGAGSIAVARLWAIKKIAALNFNYEQNKEEILTLSQKYNIITKNTSLLVLDRVEDYVSHKITPPKELLEDYNRLLALQKGKESYKYSGVQLEQQNIRRLQNLEQWYKNFMQDNTNKDVFSETIIVGYAPPPSTPSVDYSVTEVSSDDLELDGVEERARGSVSVVEAEKLEVVEPIEEIELVDFAFDEIAEEDETASFIMVEQDEEDAVETESSNAFNKSIDQSQASIKVLSWVPDSPYIKELRAANNNELLPLYYKLKVQNINSPSFYIQVSDLFFSKGRKDEAIRILSNAVELDLENPELLKVVARRFLDEGEYELAIKVFLEIKDLRPEEPQSYRDLATAYNANKEYKRALEMYLYVLDNGWGRFEEIKDIVFNEFNCLVTLHKEALDLSKVNKEYVQAMPLDIRITIDWSSNENDIDLWVIDPNGEKCFYQNTCTKIGGKITSDFTRGYGPEEFSLKVAKRGFYTVFVNYYSESRQTITGPVTVYAELTTNYGTKKQETQRISIQLENNKKTMQIGQLEFQE